MLSPIVVPKVSVWHLWNNNNQRWPVSLLNLSTVVYCIKKKNYLHTNQHRVCFLPFFIALKLSKTSFPSANLVFSLLILDFFFHTPSTVKGVYSRSSFISVFSVQYVEMRITVIFDQNLLHTSTFGIRVFKILHKWPRRIPLHYPFCGQSFGLFL